MWVYLFIKATYLPVLHDELATFFYYIQTDNYLPPFAHWDANNHVLNSFLSAISYKTFGMSPLALRLPNVLSFIVLFYGAFQISGRLQSKLLRWALLLALTSSPYLLEYLAQCRGYGLSISLFLLAFSYFIQFFENKQRKYLVLFIIILFLATAANLTLVVPAVISISILGFFLLITYLPNQRPKLIKELGFLILLSLPFLFLIKFSFELKERGALYYGGDTGFYDFTVRSLSNLYLGHYNYVIACFVTLLFLCFGIYILYKFKSKKSLLPLFKPAVFFSFLLISSVAAILFLSYGMGVNFPEDRAAMYLYFLYVPSFAFILDDISKKRPSMKWVGILLFYVPILSILNAQPNEPYFTSQDRTSPELFEYVANTPNNFKFPNTVGGYKTQEFCWYYLSALKGGLQSKLHTNYHIALDADFQLVRDGRIEDSILFDFYKPVKADPIADLTLFERKEKLPKKLIYSADINPTAGFIEDEFYNILEIDIDSLTNKTLYLGAEMTLDAKIKPFISWLSATVFDSDGKPIYSEYIALDWLRKDWDGTLNNLLQGTLLHNITEDARVLKFYIWNIEKTSFSIPNGKCYLYELKRDFPNQY